MQKTAYALRISDWLSDVCSSDLSIFVNPIQFGANEDLDRYPRREASDAKLLSDRGCDVLWAPPVEEVYPPGFATNVSVGGVSEGLCGGSRPGHFDGVATVVATLFNPIRDRKRVV